MKIRNKCIFDDYKSQIISALKTERFLNFPKKKDCDLLYIFTYFFSVSSLLLYLEVSYTVLDISRLNRSDET